MQIFVFSESLIDIETKSRVMGDPVAGKYITVRLSKSTGCALCSHQIAKGNQAWRPISNGKNRWMRLCTNCISF